MNTLTVGDLRFELRRSPRRTSVQVTVDRGGELVLTAPPACSPAKMAAFVREKRLWIYTKLAEKDALRNDVPPKRYVDGEGFPYLGRSYRLLLVEGQSEPVKLEQGRFKMGRALAAQGRTHMVEWYAEHAHSWLATRVDLLRSRIGAESPQVAVHDLGYRWCPAGGTAR